MPTALSPATVCPTCHRRCGDQVLFCDLCGTLIRKEKNPAIGVAAPEVAPAPEHLHRFGPPPVDPAEEAPRPHPLVFGLRIWWATLIAGLLLGPILFLFPRMGWFLTSLVHETGHTAMAWLFGAPAFPAISLAGHAVSIHGEPSVLFRWMVTAALLGLAWFVRRNPRRLTVVLSGVALYPLLAFTSAREVLFLAGGHLGELAFAAWALHRALSGGFTDSLAERFTHAGVGFYLVMRDVVLFSGLIWSEIARETYRGNGSFGLANDLLRLAREFACPLSTVGLVMLGIAAIPPISAFVRALFTTE